MLPGEKPISLKVRLETELKVLRRSVKYDRVTVESLGKMEALIAELPEQDGVVNAGQFGAWVDQQAQIAIGQIEGKLALMPPQSQGTYMLLAAMQELAWVKIAFFQSLVMAGLVYNEPQPREERGTDGDGGSGLIC
jgi:hypothetical protein